MAGARLPQGIALALGALVSALAVGCGAEATGGAGQEPPLRAATVEPRECPLDWPGGFAARPVSKWVRAFVERAGYRVVATQHSSLVAAGRGHEFSIWAIEDTPRDPHLADPADFDVVARVGAVAVYGRAGMVDWWPVQGFHVWVQQGPNRGPRVFSVAPPPDEVAPLVKASLATPALPPC